MRPTIPLLALALAGCQQAGTVVSPSVPPAQAALGAEYEAQISALKDVVKGKEAKLDSIAGAAVAIREVGLPNTPDSRGKPVIEKETGVVQDNAGPASPEARAKALERANALLREDVAKANELYGKAKSEADGLTKQIEAKNADIEDRDRALEQLKADVAIERERLARESQAKFDAKQKELDDYKSAQAKKDRRLWVNTLRFGGVALVFLGILFIAITKGTEIVRGGILALGGALVIGIGMAYDIVSSQPWFPYAAGILGLAIICSLVWAGVHFYKQGTLTTKLAATVNDLKTEAETLGEDGKALWSKVEPHIEYRLGKAGSKAREEFRKLQIKLGLDEH